MVNIDVFWRGIFFINMQCEVFVPSRDNPKRCVRSGNCPQHNRTLGVSEDRRPESVCWKTGKQP